MVVVMLVMQCAVQDACCVVVYDIVSILLQSYAC